MIRLIEMVDIDEFEDRTGRPFTRPGRGQRKGRAS